MAQAPKPTAPKPTGDIIDRGLHNFEGKRPGVLRAGWYYNTAKGAYGYVTGFPIVRNVAPLWENTAEAVLGLTPLKSSSGAPEGGERKAVANLDHKVTDVLGAVDDFIDDKKDAGIGLVKTAKDTALDLAFHPTKIPGAAVNGVKGVTSYTYNTTTGAISGTYNYTTSTVGSVFSSLTGYGAQAKDKAAATATSAKDQAAAVYNDPKGAIDKASATAQKNAASAKQYAANLAHKGQETVEHATQQAKRSTAE